MHSLPAVSQLWVSPGTGRAGQDLLTPWLTHVRCQELQKAPGATQQLGGLKIVPVALADPELGLADLNVPAPARSSVPGTTLDFVPRWLQDLAGGTAVVASQARGGELGVCVVDAGRWKCCLTITRELLGQGNSCWVSTRGVLLLPGRVEEQMGRAL